ncbi:Site-specific recombinase XerD [Cyclobacterium lianum]|uniref:Site-specific recombinase XerD n=1 Tax=Cyclobacterium lianum TaxID=388280 RepID=A0A1M7N2K2_9BACT|nr:tyrosine-type recombinase/integrase [Cyclobacterium lianum]SHM97578.1 Site-specific recombinase XerD [Cyclobacterium lianum]
MNIQAVLKNVNPKSKIGTINIYLNFVTEFDRNQIFVKTPIRIEKRYWNNGKIRKSHPNYNEYSQLLASEQGAVLDLVNDLRLQGVPITSDSFKSYRDKKNEGIKDLITLAKDYISIRTDATKRLRDKLNNLVTRLEDFSNGKKFYPSQINQKWVNAFSTYLQTPQPNHPNKYLRTGQQPATIHKTFKFLKQVLHFYSKTGVIDDSFKSLNYPKAFTQKQMVFIESEIRKLIEYQPTRDSIKRVKDLALIQLFTGLRYSDAIKINQSNIFNGQLAITAEKTNQNINIPLHPALKNILEKYDYDLSPLKITNQRYNDHLKDLVKLAGIESKAEYIYFENRVKKTCQKHKYDLVASHTFRRTFITNAIIKGIPLHVIQSITGHTTLKQLSEYVNIADSIKQQEMNKMNELFKV